MSIDGRWNITLKTPMGDQAGHLELRSDGRSLTGTQSAMGETIDIQDGRIDGNQASWTVSATRPMPMRIKFTASVDGDEISGQSKAGPFLAPFSGSRAGTPGVSTETTIDADGT